MMTLQNTGAKVQIIYELAIWNSQIIFL